MTQIVFGCCCRRAKNEGMKSSSQKKKNPGRTDGRQGRTHALRRNRGDVCSCGHQDGGRSTTDRMRVRPIIFSERAAYDHKVSVLRIHARNPPDQWRRWEGAQRENLEVHRAGMSSMREGAERDYRSHCNPDRHPRRYQEHQRLTLPPGACSLAAGSSTRQAYRAERDSHLYRCSRRARPGRESVGNSLRCSLLWAALGSAEEGPIDIRAQLFAGDFAAGGALDCGAALGGDWASPGDPLIHCRWRYGKARCQRSLASKGFASGFDWVHENYYIALLTERQAMLTH